MTRAGPVRARRAPATRTALGPIGTVLAPGRSRSSACCSSASSRSTCSTASCRSGSAAIGNGNGGNDGGPARTAAPSNVVVVPEEAAFEGSIVYAKAGNIWIQTERGRQQLTSSGGRLDAVLVGRRRLDLLHPLEGRDAATGRSGGATAATTSTCRTSCASGRRQRRARAPGDRAGQGRPAQVVRLDAPARPVAGRQDDRPRHRRPEARRTRTSSSSSSTSRPRSCAGPASARSGVLGHQDPEWRPDGQLLLYTQNGRDGSRGAPVIMRYDTRDRRRRAR